MNPILSMHHISKAFAGVRALEDVSFACRPGTVHALVGENGAGKSTLMKILAGVYQPDRGEITYRGQKLTQHNARNALKSGIRIVYQELNLLPTLTVSENIFLGHEPRNRFGLIDNRRMRQESAQLLERLSIHFSGDAQVGDLSVAQQQMVEIAKALSEKADLLVMDEPSAILAGQELAQLFTIIRALVAQGVTIIYISHRLNEIFEIADEVTVLKDGQVVGNAPISQITRSELVQMMVGRPLEEVFPAGSSYPGQPVLTVEGLSNAKIHNISFTLHAGEIVGLAGMVGSGRTEVARAIFGADPITSGRIILNGQALNFESPRQAIGKGVVLAPEERKTQGLFLDQSIGNNLTLPILNRLTHNGIVQSALETSVIERARQSLSIVMASPSQPVQMLSGGNQQKVVLAKWLETKPVVIILDEPTRGIDVGAKFEIYQLMRRLVDSNEDRLGVAILMISSELPEILGMSDRILVMNNGYLAGELSRAEASEERVIELATSVLA